MANDVRVNVHETDVSLTVRDKNQRRSASVRDGNMQSRAGSYERDPFYVGAKAKVEQLEDGALITLEDKDGETQARVYNGEKGEKGDAGTTDYEQLDNQPSVNGYTLIGGKLAEDYNLQDKINVITEQMIDDLFYGRG